MPITISDTIKFEEARWRYLDSHIRKLFPSNINEKKVCPWVPRTLEHYLRHCREVKRGLYDYRAHVLISNKGVITFFRGPAFGGKSFGSVDTMRNPPNFSPVLCLETMWTPQFNVPWLAIAPWPCPTELEWEGPSRIQTEGGRYGRMLPIPRVPDGWPGFNPDYKECARAQPLPFDDVQPLPDFETIWFPPEEIEDEEVARLLPADVVNQLNHPIM
jgi:hypothetical protein